MTEPVRMPATQRYKVTDEDVVRDVVTWQPPTASHEGLKDFMVQQLTESIKFDCSPWPFEPPTREGRVWLDQQLKHAHEQIRRTASKVAAERARCAEANTWIDQLYASLPESATASNDLRTSPDWPALGRADCDVPGCRGTDNQYICPRCDSTGFIGGEKAKRLPLTENR